MQNAALSSEQVDTHRNEPQCAHGLSQALLTRRDPRRSARIARPSPSIGPENLLLTRTCDLKARGSTLRTAQLKELATLTHRISGESARLCTELGIFFHKGRFRYQDPEKSVAS